MQALLCNVPVQSFAPSTSSLSSSPTHQSPPTASSPDVIPRTRSPSSDPPRLSLPELLRPRGAGPHPLAAVHRGFLSPASTPEAPDSLFSVKQSAPGKYLAKLQSTDS